MFFGDIVTITSTGVVVRRKALRPVGIYDQSICWGVWVANPYEGAHYGHPNLVISPFHPSSWPFLVRLRLVLENRKGALWEASKLLEEHDLSIVFAECTPTGFTHVTWAVIAESTCGRMDWLRRRKEDFDRKHGEVRIPGSAGYGEARDIANSIAAHMLSQVRQLEGVFERRLAEQQGGAATTPPLFHIRGAEHDSRFLYDGEQVARVMAELGQGTPETNREYLRSSVAWPAEVSYVHRLAYFSIYGGGEDVPFRLQYDADATLIRMTEQGDALTGGSFALAPLPMPAIGAFNSEEKFLRLCPVTPQFLRRPLARIDLDYEVKQSRHDAKASKGFLRRVCEALRDDVDHLHVWNKLTKHRYGHEEGRITFIADVDPAGHQRVEERLKTINDDKSDRLAAITIRAARVYEYPMKKLFFSIHFGHPREKNLRQLVERAALEEGFISVVVETHTEPVTQAVGGRLSDCQAFLQLLYVDKLPRRLNLPPWISHEYSIALDRGMPTIRLVDVSKVDSVWWRNNLSVNADQPLKEFRLDLSDDDLRLHIQEAIRELAKAPPRGRL